MLLRKIGRAELILSNAKIKIAEDIQSLLQPFEKPLTDLQGSKYPTINKIFEYIYIMEKRYFNSYYFHVNNSVKLKLF